MMVFRVHYMTAPAVPHVYCRVFVAPRINETFAAVGSLTMRKNDFESFRNRFDAEFIEEESGQ